MHTKQIFAVAGMVLLAGVVGLFLFGEADTEHQELLRYACSDDYAFSVSFLDEDEAEMLLYLPEEENSLFLERRQLDSDAEYTTADESVRFRYEAQEGGSILRDDARVAEGCTVDSGSIIPQ